GKAAMTAAEQSAQRALTAAAVARYGKWGVRAMNAAGRVAGDAVEALGTTLTTGLPRTMATINERRAGTLLGKVNDGGRIVYDRAEGRETGAESYLKGGLAAFFENESEMWGEYFSPIRNFANAAARDIGFARRAVEAVTASPVSGKLGMLNKFRQRAHISGLMGEYAEEVLNNMANAICIGDMNFTGGVFRPKRGDYKTDKEYDEAVEKWNGSVLNAETNLETFLSVAAMLAPMAAVEKGGRYYNTYKARQALSTSADLLDKSLGADVAGPVMRAMREAESLQEMSKVYLGALADGTVNDQKQARALMDYAGRLAAYQSVNTSDAVENLNAGRLRRDSKNAYEAGHEMEAGNRHQAALEYDQAAAEAEKAFGGQAAMAIPGMDLDEFGRFAATLDERQRGVATRYYLTGLRVAGIYAGEVERADGEADKYGNTLRLMQDGDGQVWRGSNLAEDEYIVPSSLQDGGQTIVVRNMRAGTLRMVPRDQAGEIASTDAGEAIEARRAQLTGRARQAVRWNLDHHNLTVRPQVGSTVTTGQDAEGKPQRMRVMGVDAEGRLLLLTTRMNAETGEEEPVSGQPVAATPGQLLDAQDAYYEALDAARREEQRGALQETEERAASDNAARETGKPAQETEETGKPTQETEETEESAPDTPSARTRGQVGQDLDRTERGQAAHALLDGWLRNGEDDTEAVHEQIDQVDDTEWDAETKRLAHEYVDGKGEGNTSDTTRVSVERDENGSPFVLGENGSSNLGVISEEQAREMPSRTAAPVRLAVGNENYGLIHMRKHLDQLRQNGYQSVERFVEDVLRTKDEIRLGKVYTDTKTGEPKETYLLVKRGKKGNVLYVELVPGGDYYTINSGGVFKNSYVEKRKVLWSASTEHSATSGNSQDFPSAPTTPESDDVSALSQSLSSAGKGSDISDTAQEGGGKSSTLDEAVARGDADAAWDALVEETGGDVRMAQTVAQSMLDDKREALKKAEKARARKADTIVGKIAAEREREAAVERARTDLALWQDIAGTPARRAGQESLRQAEEARRIAGEKAAEEARLQAEKEEAERMEREALRGVPDMSEDTPQNARARGYRRMDGHLYARQEPVPHLQGKEVEVKFSGDTTVKGRVAVMDASLLQPSHVGGMRNPLHFIDEAQPKERNDEASVAAAQKIASGIRPEEITSSVTAYTGAPTVNSRGEVIQGNSRGDALRLMWQGHKEQAAKYRQYLIGHAEEFGLDSGQVARMEAPVLVNMVDVGDPEAITLGQYVAQDTESGGTERLKPRNLVKRMGADMREFARRMLLSEDDTASFSELLDRNGLDVLKWLSAKGLVTHTQYMSAFDSRGNLTPEAKNDLRAVMYQGIFTGGSTRLEEMFNTLPVRAQRAILATAFRDHSSPDGERMVGEIQDSIMAFYALMADEAFASATNFGEARAAAEAWKRQYYLDDATGESYLPGERYSNFALLLATMYKGQTQGFMQETFNGLYDLVQGTREADLFNQDTLDNTPRTLAQAIKETLDIDYDGQRGSNVLADDSKPGQEGQRGSEGDAAAGERTEEGTEPAQRGAGDGRNGARGADATGRDGENPSEATAGHGSVGLRNDGKGRVEGHSDQRQSDLAETGDVADNGVSEWYKNLRLSGELDQNNSPFILSPEGQIDFGQITEAHHLPSAPIRLSMGDMTNGYIHINRRHGKQIQKAGFDSIEAFVDYVVNNFTRIKEGASYENVSGGKNNTYLIQLQDDHNNTLFVQLSREGKYWNVNSAGVFGKKYGDKKEEIWSASEVQNGNSAVVSDGLQSEPIADNGSTSNGTPSKDGDDTLQTAAQKPHGGSSSDGKVSENSATGKGESEETQKEREKEGKARENGQGDLFAEAERLKPIGKGAFGDVYDQFKGNAQEAIAFLRERKDGEALGALHHDEIGDIDLVWGKSGTRKSDGYGLAKLVKFHPEVLDNLQGILDGMHVTKRSENRVLLENDEYQAAVRLTWNGDEKLWLLTAFKKKETSEPTNSRTDVDSNLDGKSDDTATRQSPDVSVGKDTEQSADLQEKGEKDAGDDAKAHFKELQQKVYALGRELQKRLMNSKDTRDVEKRIAEVLKETTDKELEDTLRALKENTVKSQAVGIALRLVNAEVRRRKSQSGKGEKEKLGYNSKTGK
ncbi:MAG TPA: hypothetical protein DC006_07860, partial [Prevotellaceae bacterium]|nr:hypothetical protein [Prevotellaceae bacterium]